MSEAIKEILNGLHDDIIAIWEMGQQHDEDYCDKTEIIVKTATDALLALTNLKPDNRPSVVFKKVNGVYEECFIDGEDVFKGRTNLRPLEEKEVVDLMYKHSHPYSPHPESMAVILQDDFKPFAKAISSHFSKPIVYPEKKEPMPEEKEYKGKYRDSNLITAGYNQAISDFKKLNGGGE